MICDLHHGRMGRPETMIATYVAQGMPSISTREPHLRAA